jgi:hypothetical protein
VINTVAAQRYSPDWKRGHAGNFRARLERSTQQFGSGDSKQLPAAGGPQVGVSLRRFTSLRVRGVPRYQLFKLRRRFDLVFHDHVIKIPSEVGQNADIPEVPSFGHILQLSRQLARLAWLGDETVAHNNQVLSLLSANRTIAAVTRMQLD